MNDVSANRAIYYGTDGDQAVRLDPFDRRLTVAGDLNSTLVLVAPPGAGKSTFLKREAAWALLLGYEAVVFDLEGEYDPLCRLFGARDVVPGAAGSALNPFELPPVEAAGGAGGGQRANPVRAQALALLGALEAMRRRPFTEDEVAVADEAILRTYAADWRRSDGAACGGIVPDAPATWTRPAPWLACLAATLGEMPGATAAALRQGVLRYTSGSLAGLFGERTAWAFDRQLVRFDFRAVEPQIRPLATYLAMLAVWNDQLRRPRERLFRVDEAWQLFAFPQCGEHLETVARRGRKWRLAPGFVFHTGDDFARSPHADAVRQCSAVQVVMRQTEQSIDSVARLWHLSEADRRALLTAAKGSGLLFARGTKAFVTLDLTGSPELPLVLTGVQSAA